jgi:predicted transcriptional regulator
MMIAIAIAIAGKERKKERLIQSILSTCTTSQQNKTHSHTNHNEELAKWMAFSLQY